MFSDEPEPRPQREPETPPESERANAEPAIAIAFEMPELPSEPPVSVRPAAGLSEPPEELHLDDAEVLSRSDIAPPLDDGTGVMIPIPKPPPPPVGTEDGPGAPAGEDLDDPWYETFFGQHYLRTVRTPTPKEVALECDVIERALHLPATSSLLDVGCGLGMHAVELAARGYPITGLDISETMISRANDEAVDRGLRIDFVRGDMRYTAFEEPFDGIVCWGTTLGYFSDDDNELALRRFHQSIKPGGVLLLEVVNRDFIIGLQPNQVWFEVEGAVCMEETDFDYETSRLRVKRRVASHDGKERDRVYSIRLYALHELRAMLERNGFRCDEVSGREATPGVFFGAHSPKMIVRAERLPGAFTGEGIPTPPPVPKGALSEFPPDELP